MKYRKTAQTQRGTYEYRYFNEVGQLEIVKLQPGVNGVTASDIKRLHALDDAEIYNNIKNTKVPLTDDEKAANKEWEDKHEGEKAPKHWTVSLNEIVPGNGEGEVSELGDFVVDPKSENASESDALTRLHEIIAGMTEAQQSTYRKVLLEEMSRTEVAKEEKKSEAAVRKIVNRVIEIIRNDEELKKYFE